MAMSEKEREGLELFKKYMEEREKLPPEEREAREENAKAIMDWLFPKGHAWHTEEDEEK